MSSLGFLALEFAKYALPLGVVIYVVGMIFNSEKIQRVGMYLLVAGGVALMASVPLCTLGFFIPGK